MASLVPPLDKLASASRQLLQPLHRLPLPPLRHRDGLTYQQQRLSRYPRCDRDRHRPQPNQQRLR